MREHDDPAQALLEQLARLAQRVALLTSEVRKLRNRIERKSAAERIAAARGVVSELEQLTRALAPFLRALPRRR